MRPNQQNNKNRSRGRNNNGGRKHLNPLSRNYESNGPDVKVRGNASHVAEKYLQLARDAQSAGDSVMAENYLQHAEHYFRIVASAQPQNQQRDQFGQPTGGDNFDDEDDFPPINDRFASPEPPTPPTPPAPRGPQPQQGENNPQQAQQIPGDSSDTQDNAEPAAAAGAEGDAAQGDGEVPRRHRDRRARRRGRGAAGEGGTGDPGAAPQPEVGDLPAFLTGNPTTAAE